MKGFQVVFEIESAEKIHILKCDDWESRGKNSVEMLNDLLANWPQSFVGKTGAISYGDWPPQAEWADQFDFTFCTTKRMGEPSRCLPFPCPYSLRWPAVGIPDAEAMLETILADESPVKNSKIFWIGADTHASRRELWKLGQSHSALFDVELMEWDRSAPGGQRSKTRQVSIPDHRQFKYLIDCPGYGYSARLKWLLALGRPVFVVERSNVEHWHEEMEPWVHYVPVAADLSDLLEHHSRLENDMELYLEISHNARDFASKRLRVDDQLTHTAEVVAKVLDAQSLQGRDHSIPQYKRAVLVVARYAEDLGWIDAIPDWIAVFIINKGAPIQNATFTKNIPIIEKRPNLGREADSYLSFMESGKHTGYQWVIFTQGDPFTHSPDFLDLLEHSDLWQDIQPLSCQWQVSKNLPPAMLVMNDRENWILDHPLRKEIFSLHTLGTVRYYDSGIVKIFEQYIKYHELANGVNLAEHFFNTVSLVEHAEKARNADLGTFCFGAIFAVRTKLIANIPSESLTLMRRLCQQAHLHAYLMERLWLHLFGESFQHLKSREAALATSQSIETHQMRPQYWNHRTKIIQDLIVMLKAETYLEIGVGDGSNFASIVCSNKVGVDPMANGNSHAEPIHQITSDHFFANHQRVFDVIFIDGLHHADQVERDLKNALRVLNRGGAIVCHDLNPSTEKMQSVPRAQREWTGDGWKAWIRLRSERPDLCMFVVDADYGVGIILDGCEPGSRLYLDSRREIKWEDFLHNRRAWLHLLSPAAAKNLVMTLLTPVSEMFFDSMNQFEVAHESGLCDSGP